MHVHRQRIERRVQKIHRHHNRWQSKTRQRT